MSSSVMRGVCRSVLLLAAGTVFVPGARADAQERPAAVPPGAIVQPLSPDDGAELRNHLTALAQNPRSVDALVGAGRASLAAGDHEAALTFFGRADELLPRDARVKAGMAAALVHLGQPQASLALFADAAALGAPEIEIAADRGLAFDLTGSPARAQQDYARVLRQRDEPELRRRMALSLAISGQREAALRMIEAQLRRNDRAAWRTQAFVLALTGDAAGAGRTAQGVMPVDQAEAMAPFFARLAALTPAQKAMAVHLGRFPSNGTAAAGVPAPAADPGAIALAMGGAPATASAAQTSSTPATRSRPGRRQETASARSASSPRRQREEASPVSSPAEPRPVRVAEARRWARGPAATPATGAARNANGASPAPADLPAAATTTTAARARQPVAITAIPTRIPTLTAGEAPTAPPASRTGQLSAPAAPGFSLEASSPSAAQNSALADVAAILDRLPNDAAAPPALTSAPPAGVPASPPRRSSPFTPPTRPPQVTQERTAAARSTRQRPAQPAHPSRHWVQIAGGANRAALPREFERLKALAPEQLGRRAAFTAPLRATNRLLVGPFRSGREAQEFVNQLARHNVAAFAWTSEAGEEIERLATR